MKVVRNETTHLIDRAKEHCFETFGKKLSDPLTGTKSYWTTLNNILNKKKNSVIPPLLENGVFITNFQAKADIFNELFVEQCSIISNKCIMQVSISSITIPASRISGDLHKKFAPTLGLLHPSFCPEGRGLLEQLPRGGHLSINSVCHFWNFRYYGRNWQLTTLWGLLVALKFYAFLKKII